MMSNLLLKISLLFYIWNVVIAEQLNEMMQQKSTDLSENNRQKSKIIQFFLNEHLIQWSIFLFSEIFSLFTIVSFPNE